MHNWSRYACYRGTHIPISLNPAEEERRQEHESDDMAINSLNPLATGESTPVLQAPTTAPQVQTEQVARMDALELAQHQTVMHASILEATILSRSDQPDTRAQHRGVKNLKESSGDEAADISLAVLRSKEDPPAPLSNDGVVLFRLTQHGQTDEVQGVLLESPILDPCRLRVQEAHCRVDPEWANGAKLFIPCTEHQITELNITLKDYHVLALMEDRETIEEALKEAKIPKAKRPKIKLENQMNETPDQFEGQVDSVPFPASSAACADVSEPAVYSCEPSLEIERCFVGTASSFGFSQ